MTIGTGDLPLPPLVVASTRGPSFVVAVSPVTADTRVNVRLTAGDDRPREVFGQSVHVDGAARRHYFRIDMPTLPAGTRVRYAVQATVGSVEVASTPDGEPGEGAYEYRVVDATELAEREPLAVDPEVPTAARRVIERHREALDRAGALGVRADSPRLRRRLARLMTRGFSSSESIAALSGLDEASAERLRKGMALERVAGLAPEQGRKLIGAGLDTEKLATYLIRDPRELGVALRGARLGRDQIKRAAESLRSRLPLVDYSRALLGDALDADTRRTLEGRGVESLADVRRLGRVLHDERLPETVRGELQRLAQHAQLALVSTDRERNTRLVERGLSNLGQLARAGVGELVKALGDQASPELAHRLRRTAQRSVNLINTKLADTLTRAAAQARGLELAAVGEPATAISTTQFLVGSGAMPGQDSCPQCDECDSILSPRLYLVDLLGLLESAFDIGLTAAMNRFYQDFASLRCRDDRPTRQIEIGIEVLEGYLFARTLPSWSDADSADRDALYDSFRTLTASATYPTVVIDLYDAVLHELGTTRQEIRQATSTGGQAVQTLADRLVISTNHVTLLDLDAAAITISKVALAGDVLTFSLQLQYRALVFEEYRQTLATQRRRALQDAELAAVAARREQIISTGATALDPNDPNYAADLAQVLRQAHEQASSQIKALWVLLRENARDQLLAAGIAPDQAEIQSAQQADAAYATMFADQEQQHPTWSIAEVDAFLNTSVFKIEVARWVEDQINAMDLVAVSDAQAQGEIDEALARAWLGRWTQIRANLVHLAATAGSLSGDPVKALGNLLHIDLSSDECTLTTRTAQGVQTIQSFVESARLGNESESAETLDEARWDWMRTYGAWHAGQMVFFYPENYLLSSVRRDVTHAFAMAAEAVEDDPFATNDDLAAHAFEYMRQLQQAERLHVFGATELGEDVYVFGHDSPYYQDEWLHQHPPGFIHTPPRFFAGVLEQGARWTGWRPISGLGDVLDLDWRVTTVDNRILIWGIEDVETGRWTYGPTEYVSFRTFLKFIRFEPATFEATSWVTRFEDGLYFDWTSPSDEPIKLNQIGLLPVSSSLSGPVAVVCRGYGEGASRRLHWRWLSRSWSGSAAPPGVVRSSLTIGQSGADPRSAIYSVAPIELTPDNVLRVLVQHKPHWTTADPDEWRYRPESSEYVSIPLSDTSSWSSASWGRNDFPVRRALSQARLGNGYSVVVGSAAEGSPNDQPGRLHVALFDGSSSTVRVAFDRSPLHDSDDGHSDRAWGQGYVDGDFPVAVVADPTDPESATVFTAHGRRIRLTFGFFAAPIIYYLTEAAIFEQISFYDSPFRLAGAYPATFEGLTELYREQAQIKSAFQAEWAPFIHYDELFLSFPLKVAEVLTEQRRYEAALQWYRLVYDPFRPTLAQRRVYRRFHTSQADWDPDERFEHPFDPWAIASARRVALLRHCVLQIVDLLITWADAEFARDSGESRSRARELYELAEDILGLGEAPDEFCGDRWDGFYISLLWGLDTTTAAMARNLIAPLANPRSRRLRQRVLHEVRELAQSPTSPTQWLAAMSQLAAAATRNNGKEVPIGEALERADALETTVRNLVAEELAVGEDRLRAFLSQPAGAVEVEARVVASQATPDAPPTAGEPQPPPTQAVAAVTAAPDVAHWYVFCVPTNPWLDELRYRLRSNLEKLRTCRNIAGFQWAFRPYSTPADPLTLVAAAAAGASLADAADNGPVPEYRYAYLLAHARQLAAAAMHLESQFLGAEEKYWQAEYEVLQARQDLELSQAHVALQALRVAEAEDAVVVSELLHRRSAAQYSYFDRLVTNGRSSAENTAYDLLRASAVAHSVAAGVHAGSAVAEGFQVWEFGGGAAASVAAASSSTAAALSTSSSAFATSASYERREAEWRQQLKLAKTDREVALQQVVLARHRQAITEREEQIAQLGSQQARDRLEFLTRRRFTGPLLYNWMRKELKKVYRRQLYDAVAVSRLAQRALAFERQQALGFVRNDYWDNERQGLLGAEKLTRDLNRLEQFRLESETRRREVTKTISLAEQAPVELQGLRETGLMVFATPRAWFERDFPGHYMRLIRRVSVSVAALLPPTDQIHATLSDSGLSRVIMGPPFRDREIYRQPESIALSLTHGATGLFEASLDDPMLLPFEGKGVDTTWRLELPKASNRFDFESLFDVLVTVEYTALEDRDYRTRVLAAMDVTPEGYVVLDGLRYFSLRHHFPDSWYAFKNADSGPFTLTADIRETDFVPNEEVVHLALIDVVSAPSTPSPVALTIERVGTGASVNASLVDGRLHSERDRRAFSWGLPFGEWRFTFADPLAQQNLTDLLFVVTYKARVLYPV